MRGNRVSALARGDTLARRTPSIELCSPTSFEPIIHKFRTNLRSRFHGRFGHPNWSASGGKCPSATAVFAHRPFSLSSSAEQTFRVTHIFSASILVHWRLGIFPSSPVEQLHATAPDPTKVAHQGKRSRAPPNFFRNLGLEVRPTKEVGNSARAARESVIQHGEPHSCCGHPDHAIQNLLPPAPSWAQLLGSRWIVHLYFQKYVPGVLSRSHRKLPWAFGWFWRLFGKGLRKLKRDCMTHAGKKWVFDDQGIRVVLKYSGCQAARVVSSQYYQPRINKPWFFN